MIAFEMLVSFRTPLILIIGIDNIRVVVREGRTCVLSFEESELRDFLQWQVWTGILFLLLHNLYLKAVWISSWNFHEGTCLVLQLLRVICKDEKVMTLH